MGVWREGAGWCFCSGGGGGRSERVKAAIFSAKAAALLGVCACSRGDDKDRGGLRWWSGMAAGWRSKGVDDKDNDDLLGFSLVRSWRGATEWVGGEKPKGR